MKKNNDKLKMLFYIPSLYKGGAERVILNLAEYFWQRGNSVQLVTDFKSDVEYDVPKSIDRVVLIDSCKERINIFKIVFNLRKLCKNKKIDVVISFLNIYHAILGTMLSRTKCIVSIRNDPLNTYKSLLSKIKNRLFLPIADGCVFQTNDVKEYFKYIVKNKFAIIANPIGDHFFDLRYENKPNHIVSFGRLVEQKNYYFLIDLFKEIVGEDKNVFLNIYGEGRLKDELSNQIKKSNLSNNVFLKGLTSDVGRILSQSTAFVLPSTFEGMPNALMEAMAVGLPCIATDCPGGGPRMLLDDGCGILVDMNNRDEMKTAIIEVLRNEDYRKELSKKAKEKAQKYKTDCICRQWEDYINSVASK